MAAIKIFGNEVRLGPITAEPVVYCTRETRRRQLWELRRRQLEAEARLDEQQPLGLNDDPVHPEHAPTGGHPNDWKALDDLHGRLADQHDATTQSRRSWGRRLVDQDLREDAELRSDAERQSQRLGPRDRVLDPSQSLVAVMLSAQRGEQKDRRRRITSKSGTTRGSSRGLLHPGSACPKKVERTSGLGTSQAVPYRASAENSGARVIA